MGLTLVTIGVWLAALDLVVASVVTLRLLTHNFDGSKLSEFSAFAGARIVVYLLAIPATVMLVRKIRLRDNGARIALIVLLCAYAVGGVPNFLVSGAELLGAALGGRPGRPLELWVNYTALGSMLLDVVLLLLALTSVVLLAVGRRWTHPAVPPP